MNCRNKRNSGSTLVMVVVGMTLLTILGLAISAATVMNIKMKEINKQAQRNFYDAESCMERIRTGIVAIEYTAASDASSYTLSHYNNTSVGNLSSMFRAQYMSVLMSNLESAPGSGKYDVTKLSDMLNGVSGASFLTNQADAYMINNQVDYELILKDVYVSYTDNNRKMTTYVKTDIVLRVPEFKPATASIYPEFTKYVTISDETLDLSHYGSVALSGNVYSGFGNYTNSSTQNYQTGILLGGDGNTISGDRIITRGDIKVNMGGGSTVIDSDTVWARNYIVDCPLGTAANLTVNGTSYIEDDTEIYGAGSNVTFNHYNGFRSSHRMDSVDNDSTEWFVRLPDDDAEAPLSSKYSSAIIINGSDANLTFSGSLSLAGHAFISLTKSIADPSSGLPPYGGTGVTSGVRDILLGESLSLRRNQVAYFVPASFVEFDASGNPKLKEDTTYTGSYGKYAQYYGLDVTQYTTKVKTFYVQSLANHPYYYLYFDNTRDANNYYKDYFACPANNQKIQNYGRNININLGATTADVASKVQIQGGNIMYRPGSGSTLYNLESSGMTAGDYAMEKTYAYEYAYRQLCLLAASNAYAGYIDNSTLDLKLPGMGGTVDTSKQVMSIYHQIASQPAIDTMAPHEVKEYERVVDGENLKMIVAHAGNGGTFELAESHFRDTSGNYVDKLVVLCDGNVDVKYLDRTNYSGNPYPCLVIARNNITVNAGTALDNTGIGPRQVQALIVNELDTPIADPAHPGDSNFLYYFNSLESALGSISDDIRLDEYIFYENWIKNADN